MLLKYFGKRALILGGTCETGLCLAQQMMTVGLFPIISYRAPDGLNRIKSQLSDCRAEKYDTIYMDFSNNKLMTSIDEKAWQHVDYLVDFIQGDYESLIPGACNQSMDDYFTSNIICRAAFLQKLSRAMLSRRNGRMVYISSTAAVRQNKGQGFYAASKLASEAIYRNIGLELGDRGITTVSLRTGYIDAGRGKKYLDMHPKMKLFSLAIHEVVETILFLLSDSAKGFNATELVMDRGLIASKE